MYDEFCTVIILRHISVVQYSMFPVKINLFYEAGIVNGISAFCTRSFIFHFLYMLNDTVEYDGYEDLFYYVNFLQELANSSVVIPCGYK